MSPPAASPLQTAGALIARQWLSEWRGTPFHLMSLGGKRPEGLAAEPRDFRPVDHEAGDAILNGRWVFAGETMPLGHGGDPWDRPSPSRPFAEALHRFDWLGDLLATGERGEREALRLLLDWRRLFGRWNGFAWSADILERRVFNTACGLRRIAARASDAEAAQLADLLARQARHLLVLAKEPERPAERACAAAVAGLALGGAAGLAIAEAAGRRLDGALRVTVLADGGHASRSPQAGLELLLDLFALDDALSQRGQPAPDEMPSAMDRLAAGLRILTMPDARLAVFQGGEMGRAADIAAAKAASDLPDAPRDAAPALPHTGYQRLNGKALTVMVDIAPPARGAFSETATAQALAMEVMIGPQRLITNCGWSPRARASQALRLSSAGSTLSIGEASLGVPKHGLAARGLGPRLESPVGEVQHRLHETEEGLWLDLSHDGWVAGFGLRHERLLYIDLRADELRGEDRLIAVPGGGSRPRMLPMTLHFQLAPGVKASVARDGKSVLIQAPGSAGWWLRNDAAEVAVEPSVHFEAGEPQRAVQVVLHTPVPSDQGGRIRWKLAAVQP